MLIGYAYTRDGDQDLNRQRAALTAAGVTRIYEDRLTPGNPQPELKRMIDDLRDGDMLVVTYLNRLPPHIASLLEGRNVGLRSLGEPWADATCMVPSYLDYEKYEQDPIALKSIYNAFVQMVFEHGDNIRVPHPYYLTLGYKNDSGVKRWEIRITELLEMFLKIRSQSHFNYEETIEFCEKLRRIGRWYEIDDELEKWYKRTLSEPLIAPYTFPRTGSLYCLKNGVDIASINPDFFRFSCYIAVCIKKYGASYKYLAANEIFEVTTILGSDLPAQLKKHGSGELPRAITDYKDDEVTFKANDAFATIRIVVKNESEDNYRKVLKHLASLLEAEFPRSYAIEFRSPNKAFLPIRGLPKKGVNQLFANAATYPALRPLIERYARLAMREFEWYANMPEENPVMPGTFAVFALALADDAYGDLALDYLRICDGEHQSAHANLGHAYIAKHGFTANAIRLLIASAENSQDMPVHKTYPALIANKDSLVSLAQARKAREGEALAGKLQKNSLWALDPDSAWRNVLIAIWGYTATNVPEKIVEAAPEGLRNLYRSILQ